MTTNKPTPNVYRPDALPVTQPTVSEYWSDVTLWNAKYQSSQSRAELIYIYVCVFVIVLSSTQLLAAVNQSSLVALQTTSCNCQPPLTVTYLHLILRPTQLHHVLLVSVFRDVTRSTDRVWVSSFRCHVPTEVRTATTWSHWSVASQLTYDLNKFVLTNLFKS